MASRRQELVDKFGRTITGDMIKCTHKEYRYSVLVKNASDAEINKRFIHATVLWYMAFTISTLSINRKWTLAKAKFCHKKAKCGMDTISDGVILAYLDGEIIF
ncbi:hypothetical protein DP761_22700 [Salmonella enterica subsp. enterica]|nr:hypothetical protein [Salmonella enterica subsp. enterica serovar Reading]MLO25790.1 hypothetical protein [Salmonella enterica subsp. enterica serovar Reading]